MDIPWLEDATHLSNVEIVREGDPGISVKLKLKKNQAENTKISLVIIARRRAPRNMEQVSRKTKNNC